MKRLLIYIVACALSVVCASRLSAQIPPAAPAQGSALPSPLPRIPKETCAQILRIAQTVPGTIVEMVEGTFIDPDIPHPVEGCMIVISGSWGELDEDPSPTDAVFEYLSDQDWTQRTAYSADGPDGTSFSFCIDSVMCIVRGSWEGGDDADSTIVPSDVYQVIVYCVRIEPAECRALIEE
ncbi:MAG: hypothetical protein HY770_08165 [Chitinivibrionia bacterium]|nr:hypothetical protein [Chitinivibrionia bacterium]